MLGSQRLTVSGVEILVARSGKLGTRQGREVFVTAIDRKAVPQILGSDAVTLGTRVVDRLVDLSLTRVEVTRTVAPQIVVLLDDPIVIMRIFGIVDELRRFRVA